MPIKVPVGDVNKLADRLDKLLQAFDPVNDRKGALRLNLVLFVYISRSLSNVCHVLKKPLNVKKYQKQTA